MLISQSGETADTIAAQREDKAKHSKTVAICNVVGSMITRESAGTIYTHAGPEIGVASTKAFTAQITALYLFALYLAQLRETIMPEQAKAAVQELTRNPGKLEHLLTREEGEDLAKEYVRAQDFLFLGCGIHYPIALEGALKLKVASPSSTSMVLRQRSGGKSFLSLPTEILVGRRCPHDLVSCLHLTRSAVSC
jgi:glucosamine--fructose-6-phosphate aminotransferase (isomerizing)